MRDSSGAVQSQSEIRAVYLYFVLQGVRLTPFGSRYAMVLRSGISLGRDLSNDLSVPPR